MTPPDGTPFTPDDPQPLLRAIPRGAPYPGEALGPLRAVAEAVQDRTQAPLAIAAQSALAVASLAVQGFANVETLGGDAPASLYCLTIAESGERKSGCDKLLMQAVREYEADREAAHREDIGRWATARKLWEKRRDKLIDAGALLRHGFRRAGRGFRRVAPRRWRAGAAAPRPGFRRTGAGRGPRPPSPPTHPAARRPAPGARWTAPARGRRRRRCGCR